MTKSALLLAFADLKRVARATAKPPRCRATPRPAGRVSACARVLAVRTGYIGTARPPPLFSLCTFFSSSASAHPPTFRSSVPTVFLTGQPAALHNALARVCVPDSRTRVCTYARTCARMHACTTAS